MTYSQLNRILILSLLIAIVLVIVIILADKLVTSFNQIGKNSFVVTILEEYAEKPLNDNQTPNAISLVRKAGAASIAIFISLISLALMFSIGNFSLDNHASQSVKVSSFILIICCGTLVRLVLAAVFYGNFDMTSYEIVASIFDKGGNVYIETARYNYTPVWFFVLGYLKMIRVWIGFIPFHTVVRSFLTGIDLLTLYILVLIARRESLPLVPTALLYYLNPISFLTTGYQGQFENVAILMILLGIYLHYRFERSTIKRSLSLWIFGTLGMIIKHIVFFQTIVLIKFAFNDWRKRIFWFGLAVVLFFLTFLPYVQTGYQGIIDNVFLYSSSPGVYGISTLIDFPLMTELFIIALFIFPLLLKGSDIIQHCLLCVLFFLVFTTGMGIQYFVLPIAYAALRPSMENIIYSLIVTITLLGHRDHLHIPGFRIMNMQLVWPFAIYWFVHEIGMISLAKRQINYIRS